jgi:uroporphyrinogen decarboxylase
MISPECFDEFILPYIRRIVETIREADLKVAMHSCGSIDRIIPRLIDLGVDILHPLQAQAKGMDREEPRSV